MTVLCRGASQPAATALSLTGVSAPCATCLSVGVPVCPQDVPVPAASWQSITMCPPRMSIHVASQQSTAACPHVPPSCPHQCCCPAEYCTVTPQAVPICVAFSQSTMLCPCVPPRMPPSALLPQSTTACPWGKPWPDLLASSCRTSLGRWTRTPPGSLLPPRV